MICMILLNLHHPYAYPSGVIRRMHKTLKHVEIAPFHMFKGPKPLFNPLNQR